MRLLNTFHCPAVEALQRQLRQVSSVVEQSAARGAALKRQLVIAQQEGQDLGVAAAAAAADAAFLQAQLGEASSEPDRCETDSDVCIWPWPHGRQTWTGVAAL